MMESRDVIDLSNADAGTRETVEGCILYRWVLVQAKHPDNKEARAILLAAGARL